MHIPRHIRNDYITFPGSEVSDKEKKSRNVIFIYSNFNVTLDVYCLHRMESYSSRLDIFLCVARHKCRCACRSLKLSIAAAAPMPRQLAQYTNKCAVIDHDLKSTAVYIHRVLVRPEWWKHVILWLKKCCTSNLLVFLHIPRRHFSVIIIIIFFILFMTNIE